MDMSDESWHLVKKHAQGDRLPRRQGRPTPISEAEAARIQHQVQEGNRAAQAVDRLRDRRAGPVSDGPFTSFNGMVEEVDEEKGRLKVAVSIFGRATPVELEYTQVEKL